MKIISTAPTRLSLFGGGSDLPTYSDLFGGVCINMAINLRQRIELSDMHIFEYPENGNPDFYNTILLEMGYSTNGLFATFDTVIESGLGSSASAAVALIGAINKAKNLGMTKPEIAEKAWDIEVNKLKLYGGRQDQYCASLGGFNLMEFTDKVRIRPITGNAENLLKGMILFYTGKNRKSSKIQEGFKKLSKKQLRSLDSIKEIAINSVNPILEGNIEEVGRLLDIAWQHKKDSNKGVTNERIDKIYSDAKKAGALGGKIMGAGGGGFMLLMCLPENRKKVIKLIEENGSKEVEFGICKNGLEVRRL